MVIVEGNIHGGKTIYISYSTNTLGKSMNLNIPTIYGEVVEQLSSLALFRQPIGERKPVKIRLKLVSFWPYEGVGKYMNTQIWYMYSLND